MARSQTNLCNKRPFPVHTSISNGVGLCIDNTIYGLLHLCPFLIHSAVQGKVKRSELASLVTPCGNLTRVSITHWKEGPSRSHLD